jgi:hypothetical protein
MIIPIFVYRLILLNLSKIYGDPSESEDEQPEGLRRVRGKCKNPKIHHFISLFLSFS